MSTDLRVQILSRVPTPSTRHMDPAEREAGIATMLSDLHRLASEDGCIAAAWALEMVDEVGALNGGLWTHAELDVLEEREKQRHRWGDDHDDRWHDDGGLGAVAANLAHPDEPCDCATWGVALEARTRHDRRRQLVIAAALCIAEIERLDRAAEPKTAEPTPFEVAADIFLLVGLDLPRDLWDRLSVDEREAGVDWASAIHLEASDNDVTHPETPAGGLDLRAASEAEEGSRG